MKLTELEIVSLIDMHASSVVDMASEITMGGPATVEDIYRAVERIRTLTALLPSRGEEVRTMQ